MGTDMYWYGDVFYLTNHHSAVGQLQDLPIWTGRGHNVLVLPVDGDPVLVVDLPDPPESVHVDDVRFTLHVPQTVAGVLREKGLTGERLGLTGSETLLASAKDQLVGALDGRLELVSADDVVERLRMVKSESELALMRHATEVGVGCMQVMMDAIEPGVTEGSIVGEGLKYFAEYGGYPYDIAVTSGSNSHRYWRPVGPPHWDSTRRLERGDPIHVDLWGPVGGYFTDFARSTVVGGQPSADQLEVLEATIACVENVLEAFAPGAKVGGIFEHGAAWLLDNGWLTAGGSAEADLPDFGLFSYCPIFGHGIGVALENPWIVAGSEIVLEENMTIAVESMLTRGTVGSNFEHDIAVTADGYEILDADCPDRWWA
jgi:Xaa-Pro aminopeptidase